MTPPTTQAAPRFPVYASRHDRPRLPNIVRTRRHLQRSRHEQLVHKAANWSAGTPDSSANAYVNNGGTAQINSGNAFASFLTLGQAATDSGYLSLTGGTLTLSTSENIGNAGNGTFTQTGGSHLVNGTSTSALILGAGANSHGAYSLSGTGILNASNEYVGEFGTGTFNLIKHGTNTTTNVYMASGSPGATGFYTLSAGSLTASNLFIGYTGASHFSQTGGNLSVTTNLAIINPSSSLSIANASDSAVSASDGGDLAITGPTATTARGSHPTSRSGYHPVFPPLPSTSASGEPTLPSTSPPSPPPLPPSTARSTSLSWQLRSSPPEEHLTNHLLHLPCRKSALLHSQPPHLSGRPLQLRLHLHWPRPHCHPRALFPCNRLSHGDPPRSQIAPIVDYKNDQRQLRATGTVCGSNSAPPAAPRKRPVRAFTGFDRH